MSILSNWKGKIPKCCEPMHTRQTSNRQAAKCELTAERWPRDMLMWAP